MYDTVITGGMVVDGSGAPAFPADVALSGDRIVAVGTITPDAGARITVDASGCIVSPGFIDVHTHSDCTLLLNRLAKSAVHQGVTTELLGNCGMGCAPLVDPAHLALTAIGYLPEIDVAWRSFADWLDALERGGLSVNVAALVGHSPLRMAVTGASNRAATAEETGRMAALLEACLDEGAFGFSSGLEYSPGKTAENAELRALATVVGQRGRLYTTHIRNRDYSYMDAIDEALATATDAGVSLQISHVSPRWGAPPGSNDRALERIDAAHRHGVDIWFDNHPYTFGRGLVLSTLPPDALDGGVHRFRERLENRTWRHAAHAYAQPQWKHRVQGRWDLLMVFDAPHSREAEGRTIQALADDSGRNPWDVVCDLLQAEWENPTALFWSAPIHEQKDIDTAFHHERCLIMSDGADVATDGPYAGVRDVYAYGWAAHVLRRYVRERHVLSLEQAIRKMSGLAAERLGLKDRGLVAPGRKADIVVFDAGAVQDRATLQNPIAYAAGIRRVWVNGVLTIDDGHHTGALAGHVLRRS